MGLDISPKHRLKSLKRNREDEKEKNDEEEESNDFTDEEVEGHFHTSYSGVHHLRKELIEWSIKYLKEYPTRRSEACIKRLQSWITMSNNLLSAFVPINYEEVHKDGLNVDLIQENDMIGLLRFVQHSDSSGYLSKGETIDFHDVLQKIMPYAELKEEDDIRYYQELTSLVEWCVKNGRGLQFH